MKSSVSDRIKITKKGKILRQAMGKSHFLSKKSGDQINRRKNLRGLDLGKKIVKKYL